MEKNVHQPCMIPSYVTPGKMLQPLLLERFVQESRAQRHVPGPESRNRRISGFWQHDFFLVISTVKALETSDFYGHKWGNHSVNVVVTDL